MAEWSIATGCKPVAHWATLVRIQPGAHEEITSPAGRFSYVCAAAGIFLFARSTRQKYRGGNREKFPSGNLFVFAADEQVRLVPAQMGEMLYFSRYWLMQTYVLRTRRAGGARFTLAPRGQGV